MDFGFSEDQEALRSLVARILSERATPARIGEVERSAAPYDRDLWATLAGANVLGVAIPEQAGGSGLGLIELGVVLEEVGRHVAPVPALATLCLGALPLARFGRTSGHRELLARVASGSALVTAGLEEALTTDPFDVTTTATRAGSGWRLTGAKAAVPYAPLAEGIVVTARLDTDELGLFLVAPGLAGVDVRPGVATTGEPVGEVVMDGVRVDDDARLGDALHPGEAVSWAVRGALAGVCATAAGVLDGGLQLTVGYIGQREQFGRPLASFQGPAMRIADASIDAQAVWVSAWAAIAALADDRDADEALAVAKFWAADGGQRAAHAFQHLHGGLGLDTDYPLHRYFTWCKALEVALGGATPSLLRLGASLAADPAADPLPPTPPRSGPEGRPWIPPSPTRRCDCGASCATTSPTCSRRKCAPGWPTTGSAGRPTDPWSGGWARTAGSGSAGPASWAGRAGGRSTS